MDIDDDDGRTYYCHTCEQEVSYAAYIDEEGAYQCVDCGDLFVEVRFPEENSAPSPQPSRPQANPQPQPNQHQNQSFQWSFSMGDGGNHFFSSHSNMNSNNNGPPPPFGMFGNIFGAPNQQQNGGPPPGFENIFNLFNPQNRQPNQQNQNQQNQNQSENQPNQNQNQNQNQNRPPPAQNIEDLFEQLFPGIGAPRNNNNNNQNQNPNNPFVQMFRMPIINLNGVNMQGMNFGNMNMGDYAWGPMTQIIANLVDPNHHGPPPAAQSEIDALPELEVTQEMIDSDNVVTDCAVCKEEFQVSEKVLKLPCDHLYHRACILPWLERHNTCPVCRFELGTDNQFYEQLRRQRDAQRNATQNNSNTTNQQNDADQNMST